MSAVFRVLAIFHGNETGDVAACFRTMSPLFQRWRACIGWCGESVPLAQHQQRFLAPSQYATDCASHSPAKKKTKAGWVNLLPTAPLLWPPPKDSIGRWPTEPPPGPPLWQSDIANPCSAKLQKTRHAYPGSRYCVVEDLDPLALHRQGIQDEEKMDALARRPSTSRGPTPLIVEMQITCISVATKVNGKVAFRGWCTASSVGMTQPPAFRHVETQLSCFGWPAYPMQRARQPQE